jgi:putative ATPase
MGEKFDLLRQSEDAAIAAGAPLAVRMRPRNIDEILGQDEFLGAGKMLRRMLQAGRLSSLVFYGPPGTGKTTLAHVIAAQSDCDFHILNAASASVKEVRDILEQARAALASRGRRTVLFIDELHRFNRAQQDVLLNDVENGLVVLIGATTENPFFSINSPLLSRSTIFQFHSLTEDDIIRLLRRALADKERGLGNYPVQATDEALEHLAKISDGDARRALTALEVGVLSQANRRDAGILPACDAGVSPARLADVPSASGSFLEQPEQDKKRQQQDADKMSATHEGETPSPPIIFDLAVAQESIQQKAVQYDAAGDQHYDAISAFIKSMRGSDPDAAVYWLAKMLVAGEDPLFVARRIAILASEDIGNADPRAISVAAAAYDIAERIGMPECQLTLAQAAIYMACAPKSNRSAMAIWAATEDVKSNRTLPVPKHLRNAPHPGMKDQFGASVGYQYSHDFKGGVSPDQDYLGVNKNYYTPTERGYEKHIGAYLQWVEQLKKSQE